MDSRPEHNQINNMMNPVGTDVIKRLPSDPTNTWHLSIAIIVIDKVET